MLYELPNKIKDPFEKWAHVPGGIAAVLPDGRRVLLPVLPGVNVLTVGTTGTGKTKSYTLPAAKYLKRENPDLMCVFFEIKRTFLDEFYTVGDKVIAYDPSIVPAGSLFGWNMIREVRQARDKEGEMMQIAQSLFGDLLAGGQNNLAWVESARNLLIAVMRTIVDCSSENPTNRVLVSALRRMPVDELLAYLARHPRNLSLLNKDFNYDPAKAAHYVPTRRAMDVLFFFNSVLEKFGGAFFSDGQDTIHDYLYGAYGKNLFLLYDLATAERSREFLLYFLKKIKDEKMSLASTVKTPMLFCMDEADKLSDGGKAADFGLFQAATLGREYGLSILLTTQSIENLYGLAPDEHIARGGLAGFPVILAFRPGDAVTISTLQTLFGSKRRDVLSMPLSRYDALSVRSEWEPIVTESEFAALRTGEAFVKILSEEPRKAAILLEG